MLSILFELCLLAASLTLYFSLLNNTFNLDIISRQVIQIIATIEYLPMKEAEQKATEMNSTFLNVDITPTPLPEAFKVKTLQILALRHYLHKMQDDAKISVLLKKPGWGISEKKHWLNIAVVNPGPQTLLWISFIAMLVFIVLSTLAICYWATNALTRPFTIIASTIKRLGYDVMTPTPIPEGSAEMKAAISDLNHLQAHIQTLINDKNLMLAAVSHDLRTPITRLKLRMENISDELMHTKMMDDLGDMEEMINSVLMYSREEKNVEPKQNLDVVAHLEAICHDLSDTGHDVTLNSTLVTYPMLIAQTQMKRAFNNIIQNALKYGQRVTVSLKKVDQWLEITFDDEGPGITESELEKVFQPFYRIEKSRSRETGGTGLGLAITKNIIEQHGGSITLSNLNHAGLRVRVVLAEFRA